MIENHKRWLHEAKDFELHGMPEGKKAHLLIRTDGPDDHSFVMDQELLLRLGAAIANLKSA